MVGGAPGTVGDRTEARRQYTTGTTPVYRLVLLWCSVERQVTFSKLYYICGSFELLSKESMAVILVYIRIYGLCNFGDAYLRIVLFLHVKVRGTKRCASHQ